MTPRPFYVEELPRGLGKTYDVLIDPRSREYQLVRLTGAGRVGNLVSIWSNREAALRAAWCEFGPRIKRAAGSPR